MLARALAGAVLGIDAYLVTIEADGASGLPAFNVVGLPQGAVKEEKAASAWWPACRTAASTSPRSG